MQYDKSQNTRIILTVDIKQEQLKKWIKVFKLIWHLLCTQKNNSDFGYFSTQIGNFYQSDPTPTHVLLVVVTEGGGAWRYNGIYSIRFQFSVQSFSFSFFSPFLLSFGSHSVWATKVKIIRFFSNDNLVFVSNT